MGRHKQRSHVRRPLLPRTACCRVSLVSDDDQFVPLIAFAGYRGQPKP
jgi:hypothetical protein